MSKFMPNHSNRRERKSKYSSRQLAQCLADVRSGKLSRRRASQVYGIPKTTICNKLNGRSPPEVCITGPEPSLGRDGEKLIVEWAQKWANKGFPIAKDGLAFTIKTILQSIPDERKKKYRMKDKLSKHYVDRFLKRNKKGIKLKRAQTLAKARNNVSEQDVRQWFTRTEEILKMENCFDALKDPRRVFSTNETVIYLNSQGGKFLGTREKPDAQVNDNDDKSNITVLFTASADGSQVPPFILLKYMTSEKFYEYVVNIFHPYLERNDVQRPVILFMDGHPSHLSLPLSNFCAKNEIVPVCLIASATHILQPLDVSFFRPLKLYWQKHLRNYRLNNNYDINQSDFANEMKIILIDYKSNFETFIKNRFRATGLYPFDVRNVNFEKLIQRNINESTNDPSIESPPIESTPKFTLLQLFETRIPPAILEQFYECKSLGKWRGDSKFGGFFEIWLDVHSREDSYDEYVPYESVKSNDNCENNTKSHDILTSVVTLASNFNDDENYDIDYDDREPVSYHLVHSEQRSLESDMGEKNEGNVTFAATSNTDYNVHISIPSTSFSNVTSIDKESNRDVHNSIPSTSFSNVPIIPIDKGNSRKSNVVIIPSINTEELDLDLENMEVENVGMESLLEENQDDENIDHHFAETNGIVSTTDNVELSSQNIAQSSALTFRNANTASRTPRRLSIFINF